MPIPERACEHMTERARAYGESYVAWFGPFRAMVVANHAHQFQYTMQSGWDIYPLLL